MTKSLPPHMPVVFTFITLINNKKNHQTSAFADTSYDEGDKMFLK